MEDEMVTVIDVTSQTVSRRIKADGEPQHLALARDGRTVYVSIPREPGARRLKITNKGRKP